MPKIVAADQPKISKNRNARGMDNKASNRGTPVLNERINTGTMAIRKWKAATSDQRKG